ncbi:MAG: exodeoxyribonuclease VII large subunit [Acidimicrobiia bacterium]
MTAETFTVAGLLAELETAITVAMPTPVWVAGEVADFRRTNRGAAYFRIVDPESTDRSIEVSARGRLMMDIDRSLDMAGVGSLRTGIEVRLRGTVGLRMGRSVVQLSLLEVDPTFTAGRLAIDREEVARRLKADGTLDANRLLPVPLVPLKIGLVTSRGSAAHADFLDHLKRPGYRFSVRTVQATMQGETSAEQVAGALARLAKEDLDLIALVRGGGSKLDLAPFDTEVLARAIASLQVPVITGIGHETDRSIADEAAAVGLKTPTAAAEWIVARVADFAQRIERAREAIASQAMDAMTRASTNLELMGAQVAGSRITLGRQTDILSGLEADMAVSARRALRIRGEELERLGEMLSAMGIDATLKRGYALVTRDGVGVVRSATQVAVGDLLRLRLAEGSLSVSVEEIE